MILEPGKVLDNAVVVVREGMIEAVGVDIPIPFDAFAVNATGMTLHAGLIDGGSSTGYAPNVRPSPPRAQQKAGPLSAPRESCQSMTPEFLVSRAVCCDPDQLDQWRLHGFTARHVIPKGGMLAGQTAVVSLRDDSPSQRIIRDRPALQVMLGHRERDSQQSLMSMIAQLRQAFSDAERLQQMQREAEERGGGRRTLWTDPTLEALWLAQAGEMRLAIQANTQDEIDRALLLAEELRVKITIVGGAEAWKVADRLLEREVPVLLSLNLPSEPKLTPVGDVPQRVCRDRHRQWLERLQGIAKLHRAGVLVGFSLEGIQPGAFVQQVRVLQQKAQLSPDVILELLTTGPARILGVADQLGSIAPGKRAHLVVRKGSLDDRNSWVRQVLIDGDLFEYRPAGVAASRHKNKPGKPAEKGKTLPGKGTSKKPAAPVGIPERPAKVDAVPATSPSTSASKPIAEPQANEPASLREEFASEIEADRRPRRRTGGNVLLRDLHVLTISAAGDLANTDILITEGKIARMGKDLDAVPGTVIVEGAGLYAMPGIVDSHAHMALAGSADASPLLMTPENCARDVIDSQDLSIYRALAGGVTVARLVPDNKGLFGGQDAVIKLRFGLPAQQLVVEEAPPGLAVVLGDTCEAGNHRATDSLPGIEARLSRIFSDAQAYKHAREQQRQAVASSSSSGIAPLRLDYRLEALADVLAGTMRIHGDCVRQVEMLTLLRIAERFGFKIGSLQHGSEAYKVAAEIAEHGCSVSTFIERAPGARCRGQSTPYNLAFLREAGISACLGSDGWGRSRHLFRDAALALRYGSADTQQALETITLIPARQLGLEGRIGSIAVGKDADLALFNGHPLNSFSRCVMTLVDGEIYFEDRQLFHPDKELTITQRTKAPSFRLALPKRTRRLALEPSAAGVYALTGASLHPVDAEPIRRGTLIIRGGQIAELGTEVNIPPGASVIEVSGLHLYPGLLDAGTLVGLTDPPLASEEPDPDAVGELLPDLRAVGALDPDHPAVAVTRSQGVTSAAVMPTGHGMVLGQSVLVNLAGWVPEEMIVVDPLALHLRLPLPAPGPSVKAFSDGGQETTCSSSRRLRQLRMLFRLADHYHQAQREARRRGQPEPALKPRLEALGPYLQRQKPVVFWAQCAREIREAIALADELGVRAIIQGGRDAWKLTEELKRHDVPLIVGPVMAPVVADYDPYDAPFRNLALLHEAGVQFCIQSNQATGSRHLALEAATAVAYGLPAEEALKAITLYPARILGIADRMGTLTRGKLANLMITDGDPLQATTHILGVFVAGQPVEPTNGRTALYERYRQRRQEIRASRQILHD